MTFLTRLDVINEMLGTMGEAPLNSPDEGHPLYPAGNRMLDVANYKILARGWWFNTELIELTPDPQSSFVYLPDDTIRIDPREPCLNYVQRGRRLYNPFAPPSADKYKFTDAVLCWLVRHIPFTDLPVPAQLLVSYTAQMDFQRQYDADAAKAQRLEAAYASAHADLNAEHIRNVNANFLNNPSLRASMAMIEPSGWRRYRTII